MYSKYSHDDLRVMQAWPLERKIQVAQTRVIEWLNYWLARGGGSYVSFSGGKDSTVLLDLVRRINPDVPAVYIDTGLEYPEIREFALAQPNVIRLVPQRYNRNTRQYERYPFNKIIEDYGYPVISKEQSAFIQEYRSTKSEKLRDIRLNGNRYGMGHISKKWLPLAESDIPVSDKCCDFMKKNPAKRFERESGLHPIIATMAEESAQRQSNWFLYGCNAFDAKRPISKPMSFWTEQDVLMYLKRFEIPYAPIYGDIIEEHGRLRTTGESRTGCMFCMYGVHMEREPNKFQRMAVTHPKQWDYCINKLGCGKVLDFIGVPYKPISSEEGNDGALQNQF